MKKQKTKNKKQKIKKRGEKVTRVVCIRESQKCTGRVVFDIKTSCQFLFDSRYPSHVQQMSTNLHLFIPKWEIFLVIQLGN